MEIRTITETERPEALELVWGTFLAFVAPDYPPQGVESFRAFLNSRDTMDALEIAGAFEGGSLKGVIAVRDEGRHICLFFVRAASQGQGVGRRLWEYARDRCAHSAITVNASPFAVPVYRRLGFQALGPEQTVGGIRYTPMKYERPSPPAEREE